MPKSLAGGFMNRPRVFIHTNGPSQDNIVRLWRQFPMLRCSRVKLLACKVCSRRGWQWLFTGHLVPQPRPHHWLKKPCLLYVPCTSWGNVGTRRLGRAWGGQAGQVPLPAALRRLSVNLICMCLPAKPLPPFVISSDARVWPRQDS